MKETNPDTFTATDGDKLSTVVRGYRMHISRFFDGQHEGLGNSLNGTEQVTFPPTVIVSLHGGMAWVPVAEGTRNVSELNVSISNTLFDSMTTLLKPKVSSNFLCHSVRTNADSAYKTQGPPNRPV